MSSAMDIDGALVTASATTAAAAAAAAASDFTDKSHADFLKKAKEDADRTNQAQTRRQMVKLMHATVAVLAFKTLLDKLPTDVAPATISPSNDDWKNRIMRCVYSELAHRKLNGVASAAAAAPAAAASSSSSATAVSDATTDSYGGVISVHGELHSSDMKLFLYATATVQSLITMRQLFGVLLKPDNLSGAPIVREQAYVSKLKLLDMTKEKWWDVTLLVLKQVKQDVERLCKDAQFDELARAWGVQNDTLLAQFVPPFLDFHDVRKVTDMLRQDTNIVIRATTQMLRQEKTDGPALGLGQ